jgi:acyl carrier protein
MDRRTVRAQVKDLLVSGLRLTVAPGEIVDDAPIFGQTPEGLGLGLDSIDALELVLGVEKEFGIKVQDEEVGVKAFASVDALCDFIRSKAA